MAFTVLSDADIKKIFAGLELADVTSLADTLIQALVQYSCSDEQEYQPHRAVVKRPDGQVSLFMPATTQQSIGVKIVGIRPSDSTPVAPGNKLKPALQSALTICDALGQAVGILNAAELTAFRTSLGSILLYRLRKVTTNIVVFGAGKQALWHIRLAIILRGQDIQKITVVNRSNQRAQELIETLSESALPSHIKIQAFDAQNNTNTTLEDLVTSADVIFCTTPSTEPLFPAAFLTSEKARSKTRFMSAIGSYRLDMAEMDPELLKTVTEPSGVFSSEVWKGCIAVDTIKGCLDEAGELVTADLTPNQMIEVGKIEDLRSKGSPPGLEAWLESGFVIYKSVGVGIMDIAIGNKLLELARSKNVGVHMESF